MEIEKILHFEDRHAWRAWLQQNHSKEKEAWLIHCRRNSEQCSVSLNDAVEEALCFGWIDGKLKKMEEVRFVVRYSPRKANSVWSKINKERAEKLIENGKMTEAGSIKIEEAKRSGNWYRAYTNLKQEKLPADLRQALQENNVAWANFRGFANSYRNAYIGWVTAAKTVETRQKRIAEVAHRALMNKKPGT